MSLTDMETERENYAIRRAKERWAGKLVPREVLLEVTSLCNLRCIHCCVEPLREKPKKNELSLSEITGIFKQLFDIGVLAVTLSGGEPLCRTDIFEIMECATKQGLFLGLKTNGVLITEEVAYRFKHMDITGVHISIYGATPETHEYVTGIEGSFERTIRAVEILQQRKIRVALRSSIMNCNCNENRQMADLAKTMGVSYKADPIILPKFGQPGSTNEIRVNDEQLMKFVAEQNWFVPDEERANPHLERHLLCGGGRTRCAISAEGEVFPCAMWRLPMGYLRKESFNDIWYGEAANKIRTIEVNDMPGCASCELVSYCSRCPGLVHMENNDISGPSSENCRLAHAIKVVQDDKKQERLL